MKTYCGRRYIEIKFGISAELMHASGTFWCKDIWISTGEQPAAGHYGLLYKAEGLMLSIGEKAAYFGSKAIQGNFSSVCADPSKICLVLICLVLICDAEVQFRGIH